MKTKRIKLWYRICNDGAGGANLRWYSTQFKAIQAENADSEPFGECTVDFIETFVGSETYNMEMKYIDNKGVDF